MVGKSARKSQRRRCQSHDIKTGQATHFWDPNSAVGELGGEASFLSFFLHFTWWGRLRDHPHKHNFAFSPLSTFPPMSWLLLPWQASPHGKVRGNAANPVISRPGRLRTSEIPMTLLVSSAVTHHCHHWPALPCRDWHPFTKPVMILTEEISSTFVPQCFPVLYPISRSGTQTSKSPPPSACYITCVCDVWHDFTVLEHETFTGLSWEHLVHVLGVHRTVFAATFPCTIQ